MADKSQRPPPPPPCTEHASSPSPSPKPVNASLARCAPHAPRDAPHAPRDAVSMPRKKPKAKGKGAAKSTPHRNPSQRAASQLATPRYSLVDEARHTGMSNHRSTAFDIAKKLRQMPIQFVSAGHLEGTIKEHLPCMRPPGSASDDHDDDSPLPSSPSSTQDNTDAMAHMAIRSPSPAHSDASSSSDEVVFKGRRPLPQAQIFSSTDGSSSEPTPFSTKPETTKHPGADCAPFTHARTATKIQQNTAASLDRQGTEKQLRLPVSGHVGNKAQANSASATDDVPAGSSGLIENLFVKRRGGKPVWEGTTTPWEHRSHPKFGWLPAEDRPDIEALLHGRDAAMDDYMQNIQEFGLMDDTVAASAFVRRELGSDAVSFGDWESTLGSQQDGEPVQGETIPGNDSWDSDMLQDLEALSTSSDVMDNIVRILSKRTRKSGLQYLCIYQGSATDDARWLPAEFLKSADEQRLVRAFEDEAL
ncbi:squalene synthetase-like protein, partial [Pleosporales sp. CAS-2024a]